MAVHKTSLKLFGAVTDQYEFFAIEVVDRLTYEFTIRNLVGMSITIQKLRASELGEDSANEVAYFPRGSSDINPFEESWRQLTRAFANRFIGSIDELQPAMTAALDQIKPSEIIEYLSRSELSHH